MAIQRYVGSFAIGAAALLLAGCGNSGGGIDWSTGPAPTVAVGGTVSGLSGTVVLQNNGGDSLSVSTSGPFAFTSPILAGSSYNVTVLTQPVGQNCTIANGAGTGATADVSNVAVNCAGNLTIGGNVSGLAGSVVLQLNGANDLTLSANGNFTFAGFVSDRSPYNVTVLSQPAAQICTVSNGAGTVSGARITNVTVTCSANAFSVGGNVSGLTGTVVLQVNGGGNLSLSASGPFTFGAPLADGSGYSVTVLTQPAGQSCSVASGTGTIAGANVTNVSVSCAANAFTVGGTVSGLTGTLVLQNNLTNNFSTAVNGSFAFSSALGNGSAYSVTVATQPAGQVCTVSSGAGTISGANVTNVAVTCAARTFSVSGSVSGLAGTAVLRLNGGNNLNVTTNGVFVFGVQLADHSSYSVTVFTQPLGQSCSVTNGTGTIAGANVSNVSVSCAANTFTVGGTVSGLSGTVVLKNNGGNNLSISANGGFSFSTALANGSAYNVTVGTQPAGQTCTVSNGTGTVSGANVTGVGVACSANPPGSSFTTNFTGTESPISENGAWQHNGVDWTTVAKVNGFAHGTQTGNGPNGGYDDSYAYLSGFPANQSAQATIVLNTNSTDLNTREAELLLRWSDSAHSATGYEINLHYLGAYVQIVRWNGPFGDFTLIGGVTNITKPKTGDVIKATIVGNVITVFYNGTQIAQATDSTYATGNPGMGFFIRAPAANTDFGFSSFTATGL